jgi:endonuclease/exonuclease/phosphatase family metal-dependent hydrolase
VGAGAEPERVRPGSTMMRFYSTLLLAIAAAGCRTGIDYQPDGPGYAGGAAVRTAVRATADTLHIVSYNIEFALRVDSAIALLAGDSTLHSADVMLLQEMDEPSTRRIAEALGFAYRYYPATFHLKYKRDVGNAILSRWPFVDDKKIVLPHKSRLVGTHRTATAATVQIGESLVRVYSTHLGTIANVGPEARRNQLRAIMADAEHYPRVIIGGDFNNPWVGSVARDRGYLWPTEKGPRTAVIGRIDHILLKGLLSPERDPAGTVTSGPKASDHRPVWARAILR